MKKWLKNSKGLTLVELLAVIVILGIVAAIAVPAITGSIKNSKAAADVSTYDLIVDAAKRLSMDNQATGGTGVIASTDITTGLVNTGYLTSFKTVAQSDSTISFTNFSVAVDSTTGVMTVTVYDGTHVLTRASNKSITEGT